MHVKCIKLDGSHICMDSYEAEAKSSLGCRQKDKNKFPITVFIVQYMRQSWANEELGFVRGVIFCS